MVEGVYDTLVDEIAWEPRPRIHVTLIDRTDSANGFASVVPYPSITIFVTAPTDASTLNLYEDWSTAIFTHELTHILHMDTNHGIVRATRAVIGRIASTNDLSPWWMIEGYATFQETRYTPGGRGRAAWPDMIKRTAVVEDDFPPLGNMDGMQPNPPGGNLRYLFGQDFIQYVSDHTGRDAWTRWVHIYGGSIPYILPSKKVFGRRLVPLYADWKAHLHETYEEQADAVRAEGETVGRLVSDSEASCIAPAFSPDGDHLVWSCYDLREGSAIWMSDGAGFAREKLLQDRGAGYFTWRSDSKAFVYAGSHIVNRFNTWSDIYLHTIGGSTTALTQGARARDPDFSPDGSQLLYVTNRAQNNQLETMTVDRRRNRLTEHTDHTQYSTPRFSPDGSMVALSVWQDGRRDLWLNHADGSPARRLTQDTAIDADPVWSADGEWLYFSSDRSGIPNIYAIELDTEHLYQVTNVVTGAVKPTLHPNGKRLAYQQYSADGWDIRVLDLDPDVHFIDRGMLPRSIRYGTPIRELLPAGAEPVETVETAALWSGEDPGTARRGPTPFRPPTVSLAPTLGLRPQAPPSEVLDTFDDTDVEDVFGAEQDYPFSVEPQRYSPLPSLLPRYVLPFLQTTPFRPGPGFDFTCVDERLFCPGLQLTLASSATDALARYRWGGSVSYRTDAEYLGGNAVFTLNRWIPVYSFGVSTRAAAALTSLPLTDPDNLVDEDGDLLLFATDPPTIYWEKRSSVFATVSYPYRLRSTVFANYTFTERRSLNPLPSNTYLPGVPLRGFVGALSGGWRYSWSQQTPYAISLEDGRIFSLVGSVLHPWLGTFLRNPETEELEPFTQLQLTSEVREYWVNPWLSNHVLAARAAAGVTLGTSAFLGNYQLGGSFGDGSFGVTPDNFRMIRGYPVGFDIGDMYWLASSEYRLPLAYVNRGVGTVPAFFRNVSALAFVDAGNAFNNPSLFTGRPSTAQELVNAATANPMLGVGAEVQIRAVLAWSAGISLRLGYGIGLTEGGFDPRVDPLSPLYAQLGGSF